jgi:hypothetical protein
VSYYSKYDKGDWKALCDVCGREYKASQLQKRWDGLMCCRHDWEPRQPQDFVRGVADTQIVPWSRPEPADSYIPVTTAQQMIVYPVVSIAKLLTVLIYAPWNMHFYSNVTPTITITRKLPTTPTSVNGSALNTKTLG